MVLFFNCGTCSAQHGDISLQQAHEAPLPTYDAVAVVEPSSVLQAEDGPTHGPLDKVVHFSTTPSGTPPQEDTADSVDNVAPSKMLDVSSTTGEETPEEDQPSLPPDILGRSSVEDPATAVPSPDIDRPTGADSPRRQSQNHGSAAKAEESFASKDNSHLLTLAALLPQRVIEDLVDQRRLGKPVRPHFATQSIEAALLFIDISGFTASMEMFAKQGSQGIEKFWRMFNAYFCDLLDMIEGTGGDIDCFAGDAILIVYETERLWKRTDEMVRNRIQTSDGTLPTKLCLATMAASQCGGRLLNELSPYHFSDGTNKSSLTLHGSIGAGSLRTVNIGGAPVNEKTVFASFVCGSVFEQLALAHDLSGKSEFCLSGEAVTLTGRWLDLWDHPEHDTCKILKGIREIDDGMQLPGSPKLPSTEDMTAGTIEARDGSRLTPAKATMPSLYQGKSEHTGMFERLEVDALEYERLSADIKGFISNSVLDKMESVYGGGATDSESTLGELRRGTVGFVKFDIKDINSASCVDPVKGIKEVAQVATMGFREVLIAGGHVNKIIMDEKGLVLLYAFGTPGCSYEYNNLHAIRVALMIILASKKRFGRKTGVGIATGQICTGVIGKPNFRSEYALAGDVVNLAARLAAASEKEGDGALCDETTLESLTSDTSIHKNAMVGIEVVSVGSMRPKGKSYDINVFRLNNATTKRRAHEIQRQQCGKSAAELGEMSEALLKFVPVDSRAEPLELIYTYVKRCNAGEVHCVYLESDAGLGKSTLISILSQRPGISKTHTEYITTPTGEQVEVEGRDVHLVKIQGAHLEQSTPYHALSELTAALIAIIVEPDARGCICKEDFAEAMPSEVLRYLELLRYLDVRIVRKTDMRPGDAKTTNRASRSSRRGSSSSVGQSVSTFKSTKSAGSAESSQSRKSTRYCFQRFKGEGDEGEVQFDSAMLLSAEAAGVLCSRMRDAIPVEDRDYGSTVFKKSFVGSQAVDWMCDMNIAGNREEAVAIGQRLVEFGLIDHVNSIFRFKDDLLFFEFRDEATVWPRATEMNLDSAKALALRINMEIELATITDDEGQTHKACFSGLMLTEWMINEYVATCMSEAVAIADRLIVLAIIEPIHEDQEKFKAHSDKFYVLRALALSDLPPTHIFGVLKQLCFSILQVACAQAAEAKKLVMIVIEDLQWVDSGTLDMLLAFLEAGQEGPWQGGCMFLLSTRPASTFPQHLRCTRDKIATKSEIVTVVELGALSENEAERLTCHFLEVDELDFALRKLVISSCSGSPLFIVELCQSLRSTQGMQIVTTSADKSRAALKTLDKDGKASRTPTSVQEIVAARIDTLESTVSLVLKVASVIGEIFTWDVLRAVLPVDLDEETLTKHLNTLVFKNFLTMENNPSSTSQCFKFTHSMMSVTAYGMLLHGYRWKLHYRVATFMSNQEGLSDTTLARHWLQVAIGDPSAADIAELGGDDAYIDLLHKTIVIVSRAIVQLMAMGQFIDASLCFNEGLEVLKRMPDTPRRKCVEIELLLQGCRLTQYTEGYTTALLKLALKAYGLAKQKPEGVGPLSRLRAKLFIEQYEVMYGDATVAIASLEALLESIPEKQVVLRIEPAAILAAVLTQRGQFAKARLITKVIEIWKDGSSPAPLCLVMYEPVVTLMSMNVILAAMAADDSRHMRWLNELERYLKSTDSGVSKKPFNLYASMSLFGMLYPMCFEYAEMVRFYHSVYRVVYHPQVLLPIRRGLMFQAASATSRVQAKNCIITQGIEIMSLMCKAYESVTTPTQCAKKPKQFLSQLMSIVRTQPTPAACAAVYQTARLLHLRKRAREILQLWDALPSFDAFETARRKSYNTESLALDEKMAVQGAAPTIALPQISDETADTSASPPVSPGPPEVNGATASRPRPSPPESSDGSDEDKAVDIYEPVLLFGMADNEIEEIDEQVSVMEDGSLQEDKAIELQLERTARAAELFDQAATWAAAIKNSLMEVRASSCCARLQWERLGKIPEARQRMRGIFDKFDTLCALPNFFTPLRLTGLTAAMCLNSDMGGCYDDSDADDNSEGYGFGGDEDGESEEDKEDDEDEESEEDEHDDEEGEDGDDVDGIQGEEEGGGGAKAGQGATEGDDEEDDEEGEGGDDVDGVQEEEEGRGGVEAGQGAQAGNPVTLPPLQNKEGPQPPAGRSNLKDRTQQDDPGNTCREQRKVSFEKGLPRERQGEGEGSTADAATTRNACKGLCKAEFDREQESAGPQQVVASQPAENAAAKDSTGGAHGEKTRLRTGERAGASRGASYSRRTSAPILVSTITVPQKPFHDRKGSSSEPSGNKAHRKLSPRRKQA